MKKIIPMFVLLTASLAMGALIGCRSVPGFSYSEMALSAKGQNPKILNLRNYGDGDTPYYQQSENLMKTGFLDTSSEEYGYYYIYFSTRGANFHQNSFLHFFNFLGLPILFGSPTDHEFHTIVVYLDIFNSNGELIRTFESSTFQMDLYAGLYYGYKKGTQKKAEEWVSVAVNNIQKQASAESEEINRLLRETGPVTAQKDEVAQTMMKARAAIKPKLYRWYRVDTGDTDSTVEFSYDSAGKVLKSSSDRTYYEPSIASDSSAPADSSSSSAASAFKGGKYVLSGANPGDMNMLFVDFTKSVDLYMGYSQEAKGSYTVSGNTLTIKWLTVYNEHARENMQGKTLVYTISGDGTSFSGNGVTYIRQ